MKRDKSGLGLYLNLSLMYIAAFFVYFGVQMSYQVFFQG